MKSKMFKLLGLGTALLLVALAAGSSRQVGMAQEQVTPGGMAYVWYVWPRSLPVSWDGTQVGFYNFDVLLTVDEDPGTESAYFWAHQFHFAGGEAGYMGLQTNGHMQGGSVGKMAIFSIWNAKGAKPGPRAACERFSGEGEGWSCRIRYDWEPGRTYRLRLWELCCAETPGQDEWWGAWIIDTVTGIETLIGQIQVPGSWQWLDSSVVWVEYYGSVNGCSAVPYAKARFERPTADNGTFRPKNLTTDYGKKCPNAKITLVDNDNQGAILETGGNVQPLGVQEANRPPIARFTYSTSQPTNLDVVQFTDQSTDPDGQVVKWHWDFGDGNASTEQNPSHRYEDEGTYKVTLTVTDDDRASDSISKTITVIEGNRPPQVTLIEFPEFTPTGVETESTVSFRDPDGDVSQAKFEVLEGALESFTLDLTQPPYAEAVRGKTEGSFNFTLKVEQPGEYRIRVTLVDDAGLTSEPGEFPFEAQTPTAPAITKVVFPSKIQINQEQNGIVKFEDPDGHVVQAEFEVVEGDPATIEIKPGMSFDPGVQGRIRSSFRFSVIVAKAQTVKLRLALVDSAHLQSEPCEFIFEVK